MKALEHIILDYKKVLKENELLRQQNISYKNNIHKLKEVRNKMNEEEKKAVEFVKKRTKELKKYAKRENELVYDDIILNLIEKLQKENEKALAEYMEWKKQELGQKDKIIDLMAETINNHDIDEDICKQMGQKANCNEFEDTEKCKDCIKQYFENKAKEIR